MEQEEDRTSSTDQKAAPMTHSPPQDRITPVPLQSENALKWLYCDPQGETQGPFSSEEMSDWFNAGYFSMNLLVRRGCDDKYLQLGQYALLSFTLTACFWVRLTGMLA